jgi:hypothetical protein
MKTKHEDRSLDAVLFRFHREVDRPTPEIVAAWRRAYPEYASEIEAHAVELLDVESRADAKVHDLAHLEAEARSAGLNAVYQAKQRRAAAPVRFASLREATEHAGMPLRELADGIGIARSIVADVDSGAISPETIVKKFLRAAGRLVGKDLAALQAIIMQPRQVRMPEGTAFKAAAKPSAGNPRTWREAVLASDMPEDRKAYWLSDED